MNHRQFAVISKNRFTNKEIHFFLIQIIENNLLPFDMLVVEGIFGQNLATGWERMFMNIVIHKFDRLFYILIFLYSTLLEISFMTYFWKTGNQF